MKRILAVDDDQGILYTLSAIAEMAGWEMVTTDQAEQALGLLSGGGFDLVIVDYHMPAMDGIALVRAVRETDREIPIVVLTVDDRMVLAERFRRAGADDFAVKPIKAPDFISRLNLHLSSFKVQPFCSGTTILDTWERDPSALPKGLSAPTMSLIIKFLRGSPLKGNNPHAQSWLAADEIALGVGVAYQTAWRYMDVLEDESIVEIRFDYGSPGRPKKKYRLVEGAACDSDQP